MSENKAASIRAKLKNIANKEHKPYDFILMLYFVERPCFYSKYQHIPQLTTALNIQFTPYSQLNRGLCFTKK